MRRSSNPSRRPGKKKAADNVKKGVCPCGLPLRSQKRSCEQCALQIRTAILKRKQQGLCVKCNKSAAHGYKTCLFHKNRQVIWCKNYGVREKTKAFNQYGHICAWPDCDITDTDMLSLDHVNDNGAEERRNGQTAQSLYRTIAKGERINEFQVLCFNHQWKKHMLKLRKEKIPVGVKGTQV